MSPASQRPLPLKFDRSSHQGSSAYQKMGSAALGITIAVAIAVIIAGTVFGGPGFALASIVPFVLFVAVSAMRSPFLGLCAYVGYSAIEGMYKYLTHFSQAVYAVDPALIVIVCVLWLVASRITRAPIRKPPLSALIAVFAAWGFVMVFSPTGASIKDGFATLLVWYLLPLAFYFIASSAIKESRQLEMLFYAFVAISTVVSVFAIVQYVMGQSWTFAHLPGYDEMTAHNWWITNAQGAVAKTSWSPASTTSYSGAASGWSHLGAIVGIGLLLSPRTTVKSKLWLAASLLVNIVGLLISGVRLWTVLIIIESIILFAITARSPKEMRRNALYFLVLALFAGGGFLIAQGTSGGMIAGRFGSTLADPTAKYQHDRGGNLTFLPTFIAQYPLGVGYQHGLSGSEAGETASSSTVSNLNLNRETAFNSVAEDMGLPGLLLLLAIFAGILTVGWRSFRSMRDPQLKTLAGTLFVMLAGTLIASLAGPVLQGNDTFWISAGALVALPAIQRAEARKAQQTAPSDPLLREA